MLSTHSRAVNGTGGETDVLSLLGNVLLPRR
jgi:hypothetical protein